MVFCSCEWAIGKLDACHVIRGGTALAEYHEYSRSAMSCSTVLTADALASGSIHFLVRSLTFCHVCLLLSISSTCHPYPRWRLRDSGLPSTPHAIELVKTLFNIQGPRKGFKKQDQGHMN